jgi:hypothetical protein
MDTVGRGWQHPRGEWVRHGLWRARMKFKQALLIFLSGIRGRKFWPALLVATSMEHFFTSAVRKYWRGRCGV